MKLQMIDKKSARLLADRAVELLAALEAEFGVIVKFKSGNMAAGFMVAKFEFALKNADGAPSGELATAFMQCSRYDGISAAVLGMPFTHAGKACRVMGMKPRGRTTPYVVEMDGKLYRISAIDLIARLKSAGVSYELATFEK